MEKDEELWTLNSFKPAEIPNNEAERLAALRSLRLLDTPPTDSFDQVTRLTAQALDVPIVLVSLVDEHRQWFKSRVGVEVTQTPRAVSFCSHVMLSQRPLIVRDATRDARFAANPMVMSEPYVRSYAGMPLFTADGHVVGTLCAIDHEPREFDSKELKILQDAAAVIQGFIQTQELTARNERALKDSQEHAALFRNSFERAAIGIIHSSTGGELLRVNQRLCEMLGYEAFELRSLSYLDISHPDDIDTTSDLLRNVTAGTFDSYGIEKRYVRKDGGFLWAFVSVAVMRSPGGNPDYFIATVEDITARKKFEAELINSRDSLSKQVAEQTQRLHESNVALRTHVKKLLEAERRVRHTENRLRAIADSMPVLLGYWNRDLVCEFANEAYRRVFDLAPERILGMTLLQLVGAAAYGEVEPHARRALDGHTETFERSMRRADGISSHVEICYRPDVNGSDGVVGFFVLVTDITTSRNVQLALEAANANLSNNSVADYLTGIANRGHLKDRGEEASRFFTEKGETYGIVIVDLDGLKKINEAQGHQAADDVLRTVATLLKNQLRNHRDVAARLGGGEFAVLCFGDLDAELLALMAEGLRADIDARRFCGDVRLTASLGVTMSAAGDADFSHVYSRAESALSAAKAAGKNRVVLA